MHINTFSQPEAIAISRQDVVFAVLYVTIILPGILGNCIITYNREKNTINEHYTGNYLLMNLAVADLLILLLCPGLHITLL